MIQYFDEIVGDIICGQNLSDRIHLPKGKAHVTGYFTVDYEAADDSFDGRRKQ